MRGKPEASERSIAALDHPRGCGENIYPEYGLKDETGSPPRMRGKLGLRPPPPAVGRITPADAGKTPNRKIRHLQPTDHPRGCGENKLN